MRTWETTSVRHGTQSGWAMHMELGERPCDPCYNAKAEYDSTRKKAPYWVVMGRLHAKAQSLAVKHLRHNHPQEYAAFYAAAKAELLVQRAEEIAQAKALGCDTQHTKQG